jgi:hypothetical protein
VADRSGQAAVRLGAQVLSAGHRLSLCGQQHKIGKDGALRELNARRTGSSSPSRSAQHA